MNQVIYIIVICPSETFVNFILNFFTLLAFVSVSVDHLFLSFVALHDIEYVLIFCLHYFFSGVTLNPPEVGIWA